MKLAISGGSVMESFSAGCIATFLPLALTGSEGSMESYFVLLQKLLIAGVDFEGVRH
jgi:hypothetical protein